MAKIKLLYPVENVAVYGDSVTIRYETIDILSTDNAKKVVFKLDDNEPVEFLNLKGFYKIYDILEGSHTLSGYILNDNNKKVKSSDFSFSFTTINKKYVPEKKLSHVVAKKIPRFIQDDHPRFVKFIEAYYEWLESNNNPYLMNIASGDFFDIDKTPDIFINQFRKQYLNDFPENFATNINDDTVNLKSVIKNIRQFYDAKGTEKSFKFFFRLLYDTFVEFYYPKNDILKASASSWIERKTIKLICYNTKLFHELKGRIIYQATSDNDVTFTARVSSVQIYKHEELTIAELNITAENGVFDTTQKVYCDIDEERVTSSPVEIVNAVNIINGGFGYEIGDVITITTETTNNSSPSGKNALAKVIKIGEKGNILKIEMTDTGSFPILTTGQDSSLAISVESTNGGNAVLTAEYSGISQYPGYYAKKQGHISFNKKLQDNRRYQDLSYVLKTDMMLNEYIVLLKKLVHPAGFYVGGDIILKAEFEKVATSGNGVVREFRNLIGNYAAYRLDCDFNLRDFDTPSGREDLEPRKDGHGDIFPNGFDPSEPLPEQTLEALNSTNESRVFVHVVGENRLDEGTSELNYGNVPNVSDSLEVNNYWVVFPHPGVTAVNTDQEPTLKELNQLTIQQFAINSKNDVLFNLSNG